MDILLLCGLPAHNRTRSAQLIPSCGVEHVIHIDFAQSCPHDPGNLACTSRATAIQWPSTGAPPTMLQECRLSLFIAGLLLAAAGAFPTETTHALPPSPESVEFFETHIRPVLVERCYECHSAEAKVLQGGLRLDTAERLRAGGDSGPVVSPEKPEESLLISALRYESLEMPPTGKLPDDVIDDFVKWISLGAPDPRTGNSSADSASERIADPRSHWAFQRPSRPTVPVVQDESWPHTDDRPLRSAQAGIDRAHAVAASEPTGTLATTLLRPHRPAAHGRGARRVRRRSERCPLRGNRRSAARVAAVRRTLGPPLARRRPLRRHQGLRLSKRIATTSTRTRTATGSSPASTPIGRSTSSSSPNSPPISSTTPNRSPQWASSRSAAGSSTTRTTSSTTASTS